MATETQARPGELFEAMDGNHNTLSDCRYDEEGERRHLLDVDGKPVYEGDHVLVLRSHWAQYVERVVLVTDVKRGDLYIGGRREGTPVSSRAWSPSSSTNSLGIKYRGAQTSVNPRDVRKVELTEEDGQRLMLIELLDQRAALDEKAASIEGNRLALTAKIRALRAALNEGVT